MVLALLVGSAGAQVKNHETAESLGATVNPGCVTVAKAGLQLSPPDLGLGVQACAKAGKWDRAAEQYILMQLRAVYDVERVADISAHQAATALSWQVTERLPRGGQAKMQAAAERFGGTGWAQHSPAWMVQHGMASWSARAATGWWRVSSRMPPGRRCCAAT